MSNSLTFTEADLLSAILWNPHQAHKILGDITAADLAHPGNAMILSAITTLMADGTEPSSAAVYQHLTWHAEVGVDVWRPRLVEVATHHSHATSAPWYRHAILTNLARRQAHAMCEGVHQAATKTDMVHLLAALQSGTTQIGHTLGRLALEQATCPGLVTADDALAPAITHLKEVA